MFSDKTVVKRIFFFFSQIGHGFLVMSLFYLEEKASETSSVSQTDGWEDLGKGSQRSKIEISVLCGPQVVLCSPWREWLMENFENK